MTAGSNLPVQVAVPSASLRVMLEPPPEVVTSPDWVYESNVTGVNTGVTVAVGGNGSSSVKSYWSDKRNTLQSWSDRAGSGTPGGGLSSGENASPPSPPAAVVPAYQEAA
ncbi:MAG: hypothetical protein K2X87_00300 [Gemmataceae bacterium]|nr:hypothetical protein [Gemmataceae bacterium]